MKKISTLLFGLFLSVCILSSCKKDDIESDLQNDLIRKTLAPFLIGDRIEFAYGIGNPNSMLSNVKVTASIAGATGTTIDPATYSTSPSGTSSSKLAAKDVSTNGATTSATILDGFNATTLRYSYVIPDAAKGQQVTFTFTATDRAGNTVTTTSTCEISKMDIRRSQILESSTSGARYYSIADLKAYTEAEVTAGNLSGKIDFVYTYAATIPLSTGTFAYGHSLVSTATAAAYIPSGFTFPATWTKNSTAMERKNANAVFDGHLQLQDPTKNVPNSNYVEDLDLQRQSFTNAINYSLAFVKDASVFMKTADGKYTAFVYIADVNATAPQKITIGIKRIQN